ncbi:hypothetical protein LCGC14_2267210, partial [marine sediment metagenome]
DEDIEGFQGVLPTLEDLREATERPGLTPEAAGGPSADIPRARVFRGMLAADQRVDVCLDGQGAGNRARWIRLPSLGRVKGRGSLVPV